MISKLKQLLGMQGFTILKEELLQQPVYMYPGDHLTVSFNDKEVLSQPIDKEMRADRVIIFGVKNELGFSEGFGAIIGKSS